MPIFRFLVLFSLLTVAPTWASVLLQLTAPNQSAQPGETLQFGGYITNNNAQIADLNAISISLAGPFTYDTGPFLDVTAPLSVDPNSDSITYVWFTVTVGDPYADPFGVVNGSVSISGGLQGPNGYDPTVQDLLGTAAFSVNVTAPPTSTDVPEPATASLLLCLLLPAAIRWRAVRRR